jgi:outer membrane protein assembly factor BamB
MKRIAVRVLSLTLAVLAAGLLAKVAIAQQVQGLDWLQWGQNAQHQGLVATEGQPAVSILADVVYDPFTKAEEDAEGGTLLVHYQVPLVQGNDVFMEFKTGAWSDHNHWNTQIWNEKRLSWEGAKLVEKWNFQSDWKPPPRRLATETIWEPVFHAVVFGDFVYVPNSGGTITKLNKKTGANLGRINPFATVDPTVFVAGPLSADASGNIYYNVIQYDRAEAAPPSPRAAFVDSWLVKVTSADAVTKVRYTDLMAPANPPTTCVRAFSADGADLPWPPSPSAMPSSGPCGPQRVGLNIVPAIAPDGTIYTGSRANLNSRYSYLVAVNSNLTLKWAASLRDRGINDGCGVLIPKATQANKVQKGKCSWDAPTGVDPDTNHDPAGRIIDSGTASPTVLPDGSILLGAYTRYNIARGHLYKFSSSGEYQAFFDFGWDDTLGIVPHENTFSIVMKDNHYDEEAGFYCNPDPTCPTPNNNSCIVCDSTGIPAGPFYITQVGKDPGPDRKLVPEWSFKGTETRTCQRNAAGVVTCIDDGTHPNGFEWCINAPAIDSEGNVYVESEDGNLYVLDQTHRGVFTTPKYKLFLNLAIGAAYTPLSIDSVGRLYAQNNGHLFVIGR